MNRQELEEQIADAWSDAREREQEIRREIGALEAELDAVDGRARERIRSLVDSHASLLEEHAPEFAVGDICSTLYGRSLWICVDAGTLCEVSSSAALGPSVHFRAHVKFVRMLQGGRISSERWYGHRTGFRKVGHADPFGPAERMREAYRDADRVACSFS